ncbi:hypothetical protein [Kerstersia gyiorum]|jgi:hypothetical protein|uniref:YrhK-like protein n=1 Tax=Kerstersia gyiorum TaxID=206506 RepID=A0A4Q7MT88_9BURK|nr:hypothetical protein [Kerstersia gyiorum]MCH4272890.1 hypothetical protein [Kerstersia gyiorum]MCI1229562.1 hypothetical protein [Kerstersia gyiorum]RZS70215.1 hypothetical protein EV679_1612 [Kerstersia gyiorum]
MSLRPGQPDTQPVKQQVVSFGAGPFVTLRRFVQHGRLIVWNSRQNRKGLMRAARNQEHAALPAWQTAGYNRIVGALFAIGSLLFMLGASLSLLPGSLGLSSPQVGLVYFLGSIPFTMAAYMQHFQSANAPAFSVQQQPAAPPARIRLIGWQPRSAGWISTLAQFIGTVAFNVNTYDGIGTPANWYLQDTLVWAPDMIGSVLFLISGYLAMLETSHAYWSWRPRELAWQIAFINLWGCIFFMTAAVLAYVPQRQEAAWIGVLANAHLWLGAFCFMVGGLLLMKESRQADQRP